MTPETGSPRGRARLGNAAILAIAVLATFVILRAWLHVSPDSDFNVAGYNIHHLFTGLILIAAGGVPLALTLREGPWRRIAVVTFGVGLSLAFDEWVFLIATDGSNASYLLPVSFWGAVVAIGLVVFFVLATGRLVDRSNRDR